MLLVLYLRIRLYRGLREQFMLKVINVKRVHVNEF